MIEPISRDHWSYSPNWEEANISYPAGRVIERIYIGGPHGPSVYTGDGKYVMQPPGWSGLSYRVQEGKFSEDYRLIPYVFIEFRDGTKWLEAKDLDGDSHYWMAYAPHV